MQNTVIHTAKTTRTLVEMKPIIERVSKTYGITNVRVFGSYVRGEQTTESDLDLLVQAPAAMSLFGFMEYKLALEHELNMPVDVLTEAGINKHVKPYIFASIQPL